MYKELLNRQRFLSAEIAKCRKVIDAAPLGKLEVYQNRGNLKWYVKPDDGEAKYLPKSEQVLAEKLAVKRIESERLKLLLKEKHAIDLFLNYAPTQDQMLKSAKIQNKFSKIFTTLEPSGAWEQEEFETNPTFLENLKHPSPSGHLLRSKSECLIDMQLFYRKIPFRYESKLVINGQTIFPDFTFYKESTGEYKYWEHFGMMDDPKYRRKALEKEETYFLNGFIPHENLYLTYETSNSPITVTVIDKIIDDIEEWLS